MNAEKHLRPRDVGVRTAVKGWNSRAPMGAVPFSPDSGRFWGAWSAEVGVSEARQGWRAADGSPWDLRGYWGDGC